MPLARHALIVSAAAVSLVAPWRFPSGLVPKCVKTTKAGASWMERNHYI
jgi:hypothetical protein